MSRNTYAPKETYTGTGSLDTYTFDFKITAATQLLVIEVDDSEVETQRVLGDDVTYLSSVTFDAVDGGGTVVLAANLTTDYDLIFLLADDAPVQSYEFSNKTSFTLRAFENALDAIAGAVQRLTYRGKQAFRLHDLDDEETFDSQMPPGVVTNLDRVLKINSAGTGMEYGPTAAEIAGAEAQATAAGVSAAAALVSENAAAADAVLTALDVVSTNADVVSTNADVVTTNADVVLTTADAAATALDAIATAADVVTTNADVVLTNADVVLTGLDVVSTAADVVLTGLDVIATAADAVSTDADATSAAASAAAAAGEVATHAALTSTHGTSSAIVGISDAQVITAKDIDGGTATNTNRITIPKADKATLDALTRKEATIVYDSTGNKAYIDDGTTLQAIGAGGSGGINYAEDSSSDFELDIGDWLEYNDGAVAIPVDGTGGTATNHSLAVSGSTPLRGGQSALMSYASASSAQGEGASLDFTIDEQDQAQVIEFSFDYAGNTSNYNDGDIKFFVYDKTNANLIRVPVGEDVLAKDGTHRAQFQAAPDSKDYRAIAHITTSTVALTQFKFDNFKVGPASQSLGGSNEVVVRADGNTGTAITALTEDVQFTETTSTQSIFNGTQVTIPENGNYSYDGSIAATATITTWSIYSYVDNGGGAAQSKKIGFGTSVANTGFKGTEYFNKGDIVSFRTSDTFTSSNTSVAHWLHLRKLGTSSESLAGSSGQLVAVEGTGNDGSSYTLNTPINFTETRDTTTSWDGDTFTAPESSDYIVGGSVAFTAGNAGAIYFYIDGTIDKLGGYISTSATTQIFGNNIYLLKGEQLTIRCTATGTLSNSTTTHRLHILKHNQGGSNGTGIPTVGARYTSSDGQSIANASVEDVTFEEKTNDSHNAMSGNVYTIPVTDLYSIKAMVSDTNITWVLAEQMQLSIEVNGTPIKTFIWQAITGVSTYHTTLEVSDELPLNKDDTVEITLYQNSGTAITLASTSIYNVFSISNNK